MKAILAVVLVLLIGIGGYFLWNSSQAPTDLMIDVARPEASGQAVPVNLNSRSKISVPVTVSMDEIAALANKAPVEEGGVIQDPIDLKQVINDRLEWSVRRDAIQVTGENGFLQIGAGITGLARVKGEAKIAGGALGDLLGGLGAGGVPFSQHADIAAFVTGRAAPELTQDWTIKPQLTVDVRLDRAEIPIAGLGAISVRSKLQPAVDAALRKSIEEVQRRLDDPQLLRSKLEAQWSALCRVMQFDQGGQSVWVRFAPIALGATPPRITPEGVTIAAEIEAEVSVLGGDAEPEAANCIPMPEKLRVFDLAQAGAADVTIPVLIDWAWLNTRLAQELEEPFDAGDVGTLTLAEPLLASFGDRLLIGVSMDLAPKSMFVPKVNGRIWLTARPFLNLETNKLELADVELTSESANALGRIASWSADRFLRLFLDRKVSVDLNELEAKAIEAVPLLVAQFNAGMEAVTLDAGLERARLTGLVVSERGLALSVAASGRIVVEDLKLSLQ